MVLWKSPAGSSTAKEFLQTPRGTSSQPTNPCLEAQPDDRNVVRRENKNVTTCC